MAYDNFGGLDASSSSQTPELEGYIPSIPCRESSAFQQELV